ncbi:MAG TPA: hypothetical protein VIT23_11045 [Terrimicrobiaceae bacterium]
MTYRLRISCKVGAQRQRQQVLPLAELALETDALDDPKRRNDATLDLLAGLPGSILRKDILQDSGKP